MNDNFEKLSAEEIAKSDDDWFNSFFSPIQHNWKYHERAYVLNQIDKIRSQDKKNELAIFLQSLNCKYTDKLMKLLKYYNDYRTPVDLCKISMAIDCAQHYHGDIKRKSDEPYYSHPIEVACLFVDYVAYYKPEYYTTDLINIAILHDTIEDTELRKEDIRKLFNDKVADGVDDLTRIKPEGKISAGECLEKLAIQDKIDLVYVKIFDRLHNTQTAKYLKEEKQLKLVKENRDFFIPVASLLDMKGIKVELHNLTNQITCDGSFWNAEELLKFFLPSLTLIKFEMQKIPKPISIATNYRYK